ncbi:uncharacterized protein LOC6613910 [Drosophila sechellia]|uniref:GD19767 n=3 Tax=melanogaster subgroup TaxID=32351 RepID=B4QW84_DROSI|nr:uncharacterized protein LOC6613910 [Drosophila sechellia]XP_002102180.1 uncharacterized protein LOC6726772 [Drosophila simulans]XP_033165717.1 uncharacterized protein LOC117144573 [Drosophila mauritiana]EDW54912.1 GM10793 [Drosophila sechellia]EDX11683.1 GD19767 [Drosophila simulans]KMZ01546.1 uncharacterized protein Dsimw501_GD19767 [Drosophila simulans]
MRLHLIPLVGLLALIMAQSQVLLPGFRVRQVPVLDMGKIRVVQYLDAASTVTPELVKDQFSRRFTTLAKPLVSGAAPQTSLPNL